MSFTAMYAHVVWATKLRSPILLPAQDGWMEAQVRGAASDLAGGLLAFGAADDHVHVALRFSAAQKFSDVVQLMKGRTSRRSKGPWAEQPIYWQDGYWAETWRPDELPTLLAYVRNQRVHHAVSRVPERWEHDLDGSPATRSPEPQR